MGGYGSGTRDSYSQKTTVEDCRGLPAARLMHLGMRRRNIRWPGSVTWTNTATGEEVSSIGFVPWPKLFRNMRSSRQTERVADFPAHVVCAWIGHTAPVDNAHYLQITGEHFANAIAPPAEATQKCPVHRR